MAFNAGDIEGRLTLDRTPFDRSMDAAIRKGAAFSKMKFTATLDANKRPFTKAINEARAAGVRFSQREYKTKLGVDRSEFARALRSAGADARAFSGSGSRAKIGLDISDIRRQADRAINITRVAGIKVANNFRSPMRKIKWPAIFAAITAAAIAVPPALVGVGGAVAALGGAFVAPVKSLLAFNQAQDAVAAGSDDAGEKIDAFNEQMRKLPPEGRAFVSQMAGMRDELGTFSREMQKNTLPGFTSFLQGIESAAPAITRGSAAVGAALSRVTASAGEMFRSPVFQGQLEQAFKNSVPVIESSGRAVVILFRDITTFTAATADLGRDLGGMFDELSSGFTRFFRNLIPFSDTLGQSFRNLGGIVGDLLGALGTFSGILSTGLAPGLGSLRMLLSDIYDTINTLLASAMPGLTAGWLGVSSAISGVLTVLGPLLPLIGTLTGYLIPFAVALKAIDLISFGRIGAQFVMMKGKLSNTVGVAGKARVAMTGLASIGFGPLGIAAAVLGGALILLGKHQQNAAEKAEIHRSRVQELTQAITEDNLVLGAASRGVVAKSLAEDGAARSAQEHGIAMGLVTSAAMGNDDALSQLNSTIDAQLQALLDERLALSTVEQSSVKLREEYGEQRTSLEDLRAAVNAQAEISRQAEQAALELAAAEAGVTVEVLKLHRAFVTLHGEMLKGLNVDLALRESKFALKGATEAAAEALEKHGKTSDEYTAAALQEERAVLAVIDAVGEKARATSEAESEDEKAREAIEAQNEAVLDMASTYKGKLPPVLQSYIKGMHDSAAAAVGATVETDKVGNAVIRLPNGKTIKIEAKGRSAVEQAKAVQNAIANIKNKVVTITFNTVGRLPSAGGGARVPVATGGLWTGQDVKHRGPKYQGGGRHREVSGLVQGAGTGVSDDIPAPWLSDGEFIVRERMTRKYLRLLTAINNDTLGPPRGAGSSVTAAPAMGGPFEPGWQESSSVDPVVVAQAVSAAVITALANIGVEISIGGERIQEIAQVAVTKHARDTVRGVKAGAGRNR